ncbi:biopolymer transport protein [Aequorivita sublithincola DSM 14238]|uniref:Biopolymer transport protein n=1 Tax=Aequorivita sublithincola (strain DSM 14238 / LMG 21431 / ACAM 643 / 9-3) TaxID=746697 RepID=I3YRC3_AEQSU|nr:biopolymer transporter ExbD [Aequorivita sublithincola]AFL79541.1 biopolymer transport protein [Aequorivita sublithincola DSM 14238]
MRNSMPSVNAGSMSDIAFLLLIFFLVTSMIPNDKGIARDLPQACPPGADCNIPLKENNIFTINVNEKGETMVNKTFTNIEDLKDQLKNFIDNNADKSCAYCKGEELLDASDNPKKASISLTIHREAPYQSFITIQDEIAKAYFELRENYVSEVLKTTSKNITDQELKKMQEAYPFRIIESTL